MVIRYICAQPATPYYTWQVEVMIHNFIKNGINPNYMDIVCGITEEGIPEAWSRLATTYNYVRFFFYRDMRKNIQYIPGIRPHILKQHFKSHPELSSDIIFYHDCDMVFTKPVDWNQFVDGPLWYASDTRFYIGAEYIKSKGMDVFQGMCDIVGIDPSIPEQYELHSGGAQYIMKSVTWEFWDKVERDAESLYRFFLRHLETHPESPSYHPIQKWTADMWSVLWNCWYFGHVLHVVPELEFAWATQGIDKWQSCNIYHNAGVVKEYEHKYFFKGNYINKLPYGITNTIDPGLASHYYVNEIIETAKTSCLYSVVPSN
jgi:hypothetical protein